MARKNNILPIASRPHLQKDNFFFWGGGGGGGGGGLTNAVQSEGENNLTLNSETTRNLYNGLFGRGYFSLRGCEKKHRSHRG